jgi:hypothetical protein
MLQQTSPVPPAGSGFQVRPSLSERLNLRALVFVLVVLVPLVAVGWVYFNTAFSTGIKQAEGGYLWVDLQKMSSFTFDQRNGTIDQVPQRWRELHGKKVILEGEMAPLTSAAADVNEFELVWSVANCCYTGSPQVQHFVQAKVVDARKVRYYTRPVRVHGTLRVEVTREEGQVTGVYHLDVERVEPV